MLAAACASDDAESVATTAPAEAEAETTEAATTEASTSVRDSGITVTVQPAGDVVVHSLTAPEEVFANSTHIIETDNALVLIDTQFLLPNALDMRAYADELGKPIDRVFITHEHPDHFLGSEAFADVPVYSLASTSATIAVIGDAEVAEKQADFGDAIAGSFVVPEVVQPGTIEIDGITFEITEVDNAEAETQLVLRVQDQGVIVTGDLIYSGVHLILAGPADTWATAVTDLATTAADYPIVLPGHGVPAGPEVYDANLAYLNTVLELLGTVDNAADFKQALLDTYPELGMEAAIDFGAPFLFPEDSGETAASTSVRDSGITVTVQPAGDVVVHSLTAPEEVFANSTHIIETDNALVLIDTQFLLPNALDMRAYADELGKPIDRVFITHEHPDHFLGSEAFADVPVYSLASTSATIAVIGDAEVAEKQADFGDAIAGSFVVPEVVQPGTIEIDGITFEITEVDNAEAETQLVLRVQDQGVIVTGDLIYSGVHLILAGPADTWATAVTDLATTAADYPIVLPGHGVPAGPEVYDANLAYLNTVLELLGTVDNAADFKQALLDTYPELGMEAAIDFGAPFLFPES